MSAPSRSTVELRLRQSCSKEVYTKKKIQSRIAKGRYCNNSYKEKQKSHFGKPAQEPTPKETALFGSVFFFLTSTSKIYRILVYIRLQSLPSFEIQTKFRGSLSRNEQLDKTEIENERFPILKEEGTIS